MKKEFFEKYKDSMCIGDAAFIFLYKNKDGKIENDQMKFSKNLFTGEGLHTKQQFLEIINNYFGCYWENTHKKNKEIA